jgi:hypothetical protein
VSNQHQKKRGVVYFALLEELVCTNKQFIAINPLYHNCLYPAVQCRRVNAKRAICQKYSIDPLYLWSNITPLSTGAVVFFTSESKKSLAHTSQSNCWNNKECHCQKLIFVVAFGSFLRRDL